MQSGVAGVDPQQGRGWNGYPPSRPLAHPPPPGSAPQVEQFAALLPRALCALPGGGLVGGCIVDVSDQQQQLKLQLVLEHRVS